MLAFRWEITRHSQDFIRTEVRVTGLKSCGPQVLGTGLMVEVL